MIKEDLYHFVYIVRCNNCHFSMFMPIRHVSRSVFSRAGKCKVAASHWFEINIFKEIAIHCFNNFEKKYVLLSPWRKWLRELIVGRSENLRDSMNLNWFYCHWFLGEALTSLCHFFCSFVCPSMPLSICLSIRLFVMHHISGTIHRLIIIFGTFV